MQHRISAAVCRGKPAHHRHYLSTNQAGFLNPTTYSSKRAPLMITTILSLRKITWTDRSLIPIEAFLRNQLMLIVSIWIFEAFLEILCFWNPDLATESGSAIVTFRYG